MEGNKTVVPKYRLAEDTDGLLRIYSTNYTAQVATFGTSVKQEEAESIVRACNAYQPMLDALKAQAAVSDLPFLEGENQLKALVWDGEQDIDSFVTNLRRAALAAAEQS